LYYKMKLNINWNKNITQGGHAIYVIEKGDIKKLIKKIFLVI